MNFHRNSLVYSGLSEYDNNTFCDSLGNKQSNFPNEEAFHGYYWLYVTICFLAPLFLITVLHTAIVISLKRRSKNLVNSAQYKRQNSVKRRRQATKMVIVILVLFYICVIPNTSLRFVNHFTRPFCAIQRSFNFISNFLFSLSSVLNPIICLSFVESYRRGLKNLVCCFCGMQDNKRAKRERITLKRIRNLPCEN